MKSERGTGHGELLRGLETLTCGPQDPAVIHCQRRQYRDPEVSERGHHMPSLDDQIRCLFSALTAEEKRSFLTAFETALKEQSSLSSCPQMLAQEVH